MKRLFIVLLFCTSAYTSISQNFQFESGHKKHDAKPQMLPSVSQRTSVNNILIEEVMNFQLKQQVEITVLPGFLFKGTVSAITSDAPGLTTITIQSSETKGMLLSVSRLMQAGQSTVYRGVVMSTKHSDMLMLEKDPVTGNYNWNKKQVSNMLSD